jgi:hypothetical protein
MKRWLLLSLLPVALLLLAAGVLALQSSGEAQGGAARGNSAACAAVHTNVDGGALVSSLDSAGPSLGGGALLAAECYFVGISRLIGGCGWGDLYILRYLCYTPAKGWFYANYSYCVADPAGPRYVYSPSDYVYEAAPDHSLGWPYYTQTTVEYYQYTDYQRVTERKHYWNIYDQSVASNCQIDWVHTPEASLPYPDDQWYDYWKTPVYLYGFDFFVTPYYGDGYNSLTEMYYGWTHYADRGDCGQLLFGWATESGGWIMQTFKESGSWRWYACHHNAGDPDCPNWQY